MKFFMRNNAMTKMLIAKSENVDDITKLRVEMQIEDWNNTLSTDFSSYAYEFAAITKNHLIDKLNKSIYFAVMYLDDEAIAMCALEELCELPQITVCTDENGRHGWIVSVYTKPVFRGNGYQQRLIKYMLEFAKTQGFNDITLTTNTPDAIHIYEKVGFKLISNKYFLNL
ncbi:MAG: GNAT family N-acetyltransferase [Eubacterium sp.]|nr:GNAT family N-acetyltransferase [Eubacterium sp.]